MAPVSDGRGSVVRPGRAGGCADSHRGGAVQPGQRAAADPRAGVLPDRRRGRVGPGRGWAAWASARCSGSSRWRWWSSCSTAACTSAGAGSARRPVPIAWIGVVGTLRHRGGGSPWLAHLLSSASAGGSRCCSAPRWPRPTRRWCSRCWAGARSPAAPAPLLEGESGANDPVGIAAAWSALLAAGTPAAGAPSATALGEFAAADGGRRRRRRARRVGLLPVFMRRVPLPSGALYPLRTLAGALGDLRRWPRSPTAPGSWPCSSPASCVGDVRAPYKARDRAVPLLAGQPGRDRRVHHARPDRLPARPAPTATPG